MQKSKKQKYEQEKRKSLKNIINLDPEIVRFLKKMPIQNECILSRSYEKLHEMQLLRTLTLMEINFIIFSFLDVLEVGSFYMQKTKTMKVQDLKIGVIGGGIMGRLILNTLLIFTKCKLQQHKEGLKTSNILVSTRQPLHLHFYTQNFGINVFFDNDKIAEQAHIIFVATTSTLDNWIILDLKKQIEAKKNLYHVSQSTKTSQASTIFMQNGQSIDLSTGIIRNSLESDIKSSASRVSKKIQVTFNSVNFQFMKGNITINPFIYVLTSDFTYQKSLKLFNFPVYVPHFRAKDIPLIMQKLRNRFENGRIEQFTDKNQENFIKQLELLMSQQCFKQRDNQKNEQERQSQEKNMIWDMIRVLDFSCKEIQIYWRISKEFSKERNNVEISQIHKLYKQVLGSQGSYGETFLTRCRKWRMAYNNFIA